MVGQNKNEIVIDGRKLDFVQKIFFKLPNEFATTLLTTIPITLIVITGITVTIQSAINGNVFLAIFFFIAFIAATPIYSSFIKKNVFEEVPRASKDYKSGSRNYIKSKYIITHENLWSMFMYMIYTDNKEDFDVLSKSYGNKRIEKIKEDLFNKNPSIISYMQNQKPELRERALKKYVQEGPFYLKLDKEFNFENRFKSELIKLYAKSKNISLDNDFARKSVEIKTKEELINYLKQELQRS